MSVVNFSSSGKRACSNSELETTYPSKRQKMQVSSPTESPLKSAVVRNVVLRAFKRRRMNETYQHFQEDYGVNIKEASQHNLESTIDALKGGMDYLSRFAVNPDTIIQEFRACSRDTAGVNVARILNPLPKGSVEKGISIENGLCPEEVLLFKLLIRNFTLKHVTRNLEDIHKRDGALLSLRERILLGRNIENSNTLSNKGQDDNIFFTMGVGNHEVVPFLADRVPDLVTIDLYKASQYNDVALDYLWVSPQVNDFGLNTVEGTRTFGATKYAFSFDNPTKTRNHVYHNEKTGQIFRRKVQLEDEIFAGRFVSRGVALQFILHLRFIGDPYRSELLAFIADEAISQEEKLKKASAALNALMPSWHFPEAKMPVMCLLDAPYVSMGKIADSNQKLPSKYTILLKDEIRNGALEKIEQLINRKFPDKNDPQIQFQVDLNQDNYPTDSYLELAVEAKSPRILSLFALHGADIKRRGDNLLHIAAYQNDLLTYQELLRLGARYSDKSRLNETALMYFAMHGHCAAIDFLVKLGADLNKAFQYYYYNRIFLSNPILSSDFEGFTALHYAIMHAQPEAVRMLIKYKADFNQTAPQVGSPLAYAMACQQKVPFDGNIALPTDADVSKRRKEIIALLKAFGAEDIPPAAKTYKQTKTACAAAVIGLNEQNEPFVVLGKNWSQDGSIANRYQFPGGFQELTDPSAEEAAVREVEEETGIGLKQLKGKGLVETKHLYSYESIGDETRYLTNFYLFNVGTALNEIRPHGKGDLAVARKVPLSALKEYPELPFHQRFTIQTVPLKSSNGLLLKSLMERTSISFEELQLMSEIECRGFGMLLDELKLHPVNLAKVEWLIDNGVAMQPQDEMVRGLYFYALHDFEAVKLLIRKGCKVETFGEKDAFEEIIRQYSEANKKDFSTKSRLLKTLHVMLNQLKLDDKQKQYCMGLAMQMGLLPVVKILIKHGANPHESHRLFWKGVVYGASSRKNLRLLKYLVEECHVDVNAFNQAEYVGCGSVIQRCAVIHAAINGNKAGMKYLIRWGAKINEARTPIHLYSALQKALQKRQLAVARYLIREGNIDLLHKDSEGRSAFDMCVKDYPDLLPLLNKQLLYQQISKKSV